MAIWSFNSSLFAVVCQTKLCVRNQPAFLLLSLACRFLDNRLFATCSDDTTIALWDLRKLNSKVCSLHGHASWVKNIEYDTNTRLLVTSGFDGNVITWDTNRFVCVCGHVGIICSTRCAHFNINMIKLSLFFFKGEYNSVLFVFCAEFSLHLFCIYYILFTFSCHIMRLIN